MVVEAPEWVDELASQLGVKVRAINRLAGGASKESWAVELDGETLLVRRAAGGDVYSHSLSLEQEYRVMEAAWSANVRVPRPRAYLGNVGGRAAFAMEFVAGETIGRRIVRDPPSGLAYELAGQLARIHSISPARLPFLSYVDPLERLRQELDELAEPHPVIELGLLWLCERRPQSDEHVVTHGDFRIGNVVVSASGLEAILDWELVVLADPREDLAWPLVRSWRFGRVDRRFGGVSDAEPFVDAYAAATGRDISAEELGWWEVLGNVKWAVGSHMQARRHLTGQERSVELAVLGRLAVEVEQEILTLIESV